MFYEQNNIANFKRIFIEQFLFAVKTYFWRGYKVVLDVLDEFAQQGRSLTIELVK